MMMRPASSLLYPARCDFDGSDQQPLHSARGGRQDPEYESDFKNAYLKLVKKVYEEQGENILITQEELERVAEKEQLKQQDFRERLQQQIEQRQQRARLMDESKKQMEMKDCTFKPQTYSVKQKRNFD
jgi:hypothetical protein